MQLKPSSQFVFSYALLFGYANLLKNKKENHYGFSLAIFL